MGASDRAVYYDFIRSFIEPEVAAEIAERVIQLPSDNDTLTEQLSHYQRDFTTRLRLSGLQFNFLPDEPWAQHWTRDTLRALDANQGRLMAAQLICAAKGDLDHPYLADKPLYRYCLRKFHYQ
ncbi:unnamed protein product [Tilletia laevis]|uniref:Uncharacterized protein n=2 Tax=Tilletia TaxID=13289 RepID=A0A177USY9_9BASI|nr:hypothetical protein CF336_g2502 [Tilletia laevis]KAE8255945.1 hypothetical protein A4X03_0g5486 [Tilletia caries]CAD6887020.1 unnamed protein product [Tilletia caries]CAD6899877.1 unnamed protein product [Tilletia caries]CAD6900017.1 unnamed protein product [Tilletia laevis]